MKWGIIDGSENYGFGHRYYDTGVFDADGNTDVVYGKGNKKKVNIKDLKPLTTDTVYTAEVIAFVGELGVTAKMKSSTHIVHGKYLYKPLQSFTIKETIMVIQYGLLPCSFPKKTVRRKANPTLPHENFLRCGLL